MTSAPDLAVAGPTGSAPSSSSTSSTSAVRTYFAIQSVAGALWWVTIPLSDDVRRWTLGSWDPVLLVGPDIVFFVLASGLVAVFADRRIAAVCALWTTAVAVALVVDGLLRRQGGWGAFVMTFATVGTLASTATLWFGGLPRRWFFVGPFAFRPAGPHRSSTHLRHGLTQLVVFWTAFLVVLPLGLACAETRLRIEWPALSGADLSIAGAAVFCTASALGIWSCFAMTLRGDGTPLPSMTARKLVVVGPYRYVRNPMAVAGAIQTIGVGLVLGSWTVVVSAFAGSLVWNFFIRPDEEADLRTRFGDAYVNYASVVRCWIPRLRPVCPRAV